MIFDVAKDKERISEIEVEMAAPGFWDDQERAQEMTQGLSRLKNRVARYEGLLADYEDLQVMHQLGADDAELRQEAQEAVEGLVARVEELELNTMLRGKYDSHNAIVSLHAGAGGTEAQDWVAMLLRMYSRWSESRGFDIETLDYLSGDEAGIKSVTILVKGENAYGFLKPEKGVHRLVRISPFDSSGRRHTSFASVDVIPEMDDAAEINISQEDLRIDTYRASGAGGQHVNKTDSAVRITHLPTGIVVQCQSERSQISNRNTAMKLLKAKLLDLEIKKKEAELSAVRGEQMDIAWGSQIRSYIFHPYSLVKDHRTGVEVGNVNAVMNGEIDIFISSFLRENARKN